MGFLKRFLSLGSSKSRKNKKKQNAAQARNVDAEGRILPHTERDPQDPDTSVNRLLRSSSTKFAVMSEIDYSSLAPPPLPTANFPSTPSLSPSPSMLTVATTPGVHRSGTYVVKVHGRTTHSRTEFPRANPPPSPTKLPRTATPKTPTPHQDHHDTDDEDEDDDPRLPRLKEVNFTPKDRSRIYALRQDPSVVSLLNMYDDNGCLDSQAFASTPPTPAPISTEVEGKQPRQRTGSTLRQLLGEAQPAHIENITAAEGDISWAERFLDEQLQDDSPLPSPILKTPKDTVFAGDLSAPRIAAADNTFSSTGAESSINYPAISSMEVEVSGTVEDLSIEVVPAPKPAVEPKTPQRASEVFGFLNRRNTVLVKERDLPEIPQELVFHNTGECPNDTEDALVPNTSLDAPPDATHSANTSHSGGSNTSSDAPSHLSHAQIQTATLTKLSSAFAASTLSLNLLASTPDHPTQTASDEAALPTSYTGSSEPQGGDIPTTGHLVREATGSSSQTHVPRHHHTGSSHSSSSTNLPPSKIPRGPRPRPLSIRRPDDRISTDDEPHPASTVDSAPSVSDPHAKREAFAALPPRQHRRTASRSASPTTPNDEHKITRAATIAVPKSPGASVAHARKPLGKENTPSPPRTIAAHTGLGFMTPTRARTLAGHFLERDVPPSPASSSELSPVGQDMMHNLRMQRLRARQVERRRGMWVRE